MINILTEKRSYGCIMAYPITNVSNTIVNFNKKIIPDDILYTDEENHGREIIPHVTIKYGFTEIYSEQYIKNIIRNITPFNIQLKNISVFDSNDKFDVIKIEIISDYLSELHAYFNQFPNEDSFKEYNPHMTLAYVKKGSAKKYIKQFPIYPSILINKIVYSTQNDNKYYYTLNNKNINEKTTLRDFDYEIQKLENEWDKLDSMGGQVNKQREISKELERLRKEKAKWELLYKTVA